MSIESRVSYFLCFPKITRFVQHNFKLAVFKVFKIGQSGLKNNKIEHDSLYIVIVTTLEM